jgi:uncharacterized protein YggE
MARRIIFSFLIIFIFILGGCQKEPERPHLRSLGMEGVADTLVVPDLVVWTVKINDLDPLLVKAKESNDRKLAAVIAALDKVDIVEGSIRTGAARIERQFRRCDDGVNRFSHFGVKRTISFRQDDPEAVEGALDALVSAADIEAFCYYDLADAESIMKGLRARAIDRARDKAESLAQYVGMRIGSITGLHVNEDSNPFRRHQRQMNEMNGNISGPQAQLLSTQVRVQYETF